MKTHAPITKAPNRRLATLAAAAAATLLGIASASAQAKAINPGVEIDEAKLLAGQIPLKKVLESGLHFFTTPFTAADGFGEGLGGSRAEQRAFLYPALVDKDKNGMPFLRLNGLDSQSCFECHNSIGSGRSQQSAAKQRKHDGQGGAAGFASTAYINDEFPKAPFPLKPGETAPPAPPPGPGKATAGGSPVPAHPGETLQLTKFVRNPPHAFGSGYVQQLALEMTADLTAQIKALSDLAKLHPTVKQTAPLISKGISFGTLGATFGGATFTFDETGINGLVREGAQPAGEVDFVVRPFQFKGIASSLRHFVRDALNFHFSIQAVEKKFPNPAGGPPITMHNEDADDVMDEFSLGNVSALTVFTGMLRPPIQAPLSQSAMLGRRIFLGKGKYANDAAGNPVTQTCATCHVPSLRLADPTFFVEDPVQLAAMVAAAPKPVVPPALMEMFFSEKGAKVKPANPQKAPAGAAGNQPAEQNPRKYMPSLIDPEPRPDTTVSQLRRLSFPALQSREADAIKRFSLAPDVAGDIATGATPKHAGYSVNLNEPPIPRNSKVGHLIFDRLPVNDDDSVDVPLYSDLKLHKMGDGLGDVAAQETDTAGFFVSAESFLTRPLWGVADCGPWLHDGRASTLQAAIEAHDSVGSEASPSVKYLKTRTPLEQEAVVDFLLTLRLPPSK